MGQYISWNEIRYARDHDDNGNSIWYDHDLFAYLEEHGDLISGEQFLGCIFYMLHEDKNYLPSVLNGSMTLDLIGGFSIQNEIIHWMNFVNDVERKRIPISLDMNYTYIESFLLFNMFHISDQYIKDKLESLIVMGTIVNDKELIICKEIWSKYKKDSN